MQFPGITPGVPSNSSGISAFSSDIFDSSLGNSEMSLVLAQAPGFLVLSQVLLKFFHASKYFPQSILALPLVSLVFPPGVPGVKPHTCLCMNLN